MGSPATRGNLSQSRHFGNDRLMSLENPAQAEATTGPGRRAEVLSRLTRPRLPRNFRNLLAVIPVVLITIWKLLPVGDPDTFWHVATGDWLRRTWTFHGPDPWSPMSSRPWTLHEWLPELAMSWAYQWFGMPGLAWLLPLGTGLIGLTLLSACRDRASLLVSGMVTAAALLAMSGSLTLRPHLVTFALTVVTVAAWLRTAEDGRPRWWLVPMTWVWACSHGMWFVGLAVGVAVLIGLALDRSWPWATWGRLGLVAVLSVVAAALTPVGPVLLTAPLRVQGYAKYVNEWEPPSISDAYFVMFLGLVAVPVVHWARSGVRVSWTRVALLGLGLAFGLMYARTVAVGAAIVAPLAAEALSQALGRAREAVTGGERSVRITLVAVALVVSAMVSPARASTLAYVPSALDPELERLAAGTVVCNDYPLGGWLIWRHPHLRPTIDPRTEIYSPEHVESRLTFLLAEPGWQQFLVRTKCTYALLARETAAPEALVDRLGWLEIGSTDAHVLLRAPSP